MPPKALPCSLIGMNAEVMAQYIEFVADRLLGSLGYGKVRAFYFYFIFTFEVGLRLFICLDAGSPAAVSRSFIFTPLANENRCRIRDRFQCGKNVQRQRRRTATVSRKRSPVFSFCRRTRKMSLSLRLLSCCVLLTLGCLLSLSRIPHRRFFFLVDVQDAEPVRLDGPHQPAGQDKFLRETGRGVPESRRYGGQRASGGWPTKF